MSWRIAIALLILCTALPAQTVTGTVTGLVIDSSDAAIPGAAVSAKHQTTGEVRATESNETGAFTLAALQPGAYTLTVEAKGFRTFERARIIVTANDRVSAGKITLQVGEIAEKIVVTAERPAVQTATSENTALLSANQLNQISVRGRDVVALLRLLPGVNQTGDAESLGAQFGTSSPSIAGTRNGMNTFALDGQISSDADSTASHVSSISLDAIAEVKVLINNYSAEYGRNPGGYVSIVSKSGTREFHGSASWFKRHEQFNANNFFNNVNALARPLYRYNTWSFTLGGPAYIPGRFNKNRDKLFFFYAREDWRINEPVSPFRTTMPTALERAGDFSRTVDLNQQVIPIRDPLSGQVFPGNRMPASRVHPLGQAMLNLFPQPNLLDRSITLGNYNYVFQEVREVPKTMNQLKLDYNATASDRISVRGRLWDSDTRGYSAAAGFSSNWDQLYHHYQYSEDSVLLNYTRTLNPRMVNELTLTIRKLGENGPPRTPDALDRVTRSKVGLSRLGQLYPAVNPLDIIPGLAFGGVPSSPAVRYDARFPIEAGDRRWSLGDNFTWIQGKHNLKFGFYFERNYTNEGWRASNRAAFGGAFEFGRDVNNPLDSNYAFSNAVLGNFANYTESSGRNFGLGKNYLLEWFAQDTWKATRKLTLDLGMRFYLYSPWRLRDGHTGASWVEQRWVTSKAPELFRPAIAPNGRRMAQNPITGEYLPQTLIGAVVPNLGDRLNGIVLGSDPNYPNGWRDMRPVQLGPRVGFAYDPFGDGRTAIRGAAGIALQTQINSGYIFGDTTTSPPIVETPVIYYSDLNSYLGATGFFFPTGFLPSWERTYKSPMVYSWSFGVQRDVGFNTVVNVGYMGNVARHLIQVRDLNAVPYGARFLPQNADPTNPSRPLPDSFLVPYRGFGTLSLAENSGISNYNALAVTADRRFTRGLQFGVAWTYSKSMNLSDGVGRVPMFFSSRTWLYGKANSDQTHVLIFNYTWDVPKASRVWNHAVVRGAFDNWQLSGITSFYSGTPRSVGISTTDGADIPGGGDVGIRPVVTGKAQLPRGERSFTRWFDTSVFARTPRGEVGNAPKDVFRGPGANNWDISLFKNFPLGAESRLLQFRAEFYNAFNHTQYSGVDTGARFDPQGRQVNARFGQVTSARDPRIVQLALSFKF